MTIKKNEISANSTRIKKKPYVFHPYNPEPKSCCQGTHDIQLTLAIYKLFLWFKTLSITIVDPSFISFHCYQGEIQTCHRIMTLSELFMFSKVRFENPKVHAIIFPSNSIIFCTKQQKYKPYTLETDTDYALRIVCSQLLR